MRLTQWTDYSLRVLMYCAATQERAQAATVAEIAEAHGISRHHLTKVVMALAAQGWIVTLRGRGGGLRLARPAVQIVLGEVVRQTESDFDMVECFDSARNTCRIDGLCGLKGVLRRATDNYLATLDGVTLADLVPATGEAVPLPWPAPAAR